MMLINARGNVTVLGLIQRIVLRSVGPKMHKIDNNLPSIQTLYISTTLMLIVCLSLSFFVTF